MIFVVFLENQKLLLVPHTHIASYCIFNSANEIKIGKFCSISYQVSFITSSENTNGKYFTSPQVNIRFRKPISGKINIQKHSWIGIKSSILQNVKLGTGTVISAHSLDPKQILNRGRFIMVSLQLKLVTDIKKIF